MTDDALRTLRYNVAAQVRYWRNELAREMTVKPHVNEIDGPLGGRKFTHAMEDVLDYPPDFLTALRRRKWPDVHYREHHAAQVADCYCQPRMAFLLVSDLVLWRVPIEESLRRYKISEQWALTVVDEELRLLINIVGIGSTNLERLRSIRKAATAPQSSGRHRRTWARG